MKSLPNTAVVEIEGAVKASLPYVQTFDNGHLPYGWEVVLVDPNLTVKDMYSWRFDNWFDIALPASMAGFEGGFASVSPAAAGFNRLESYLVTPAFELAAGNHYMVRFDKYYEDKDPGPSGFAQAILQLSTDGENWYDLEDQALKANGDRQVSLSDYAGETVRLRWGILGRNSGLCAIDNVRVMQGEADGVAGPADDAETLYDVFTTSGVCVARGVDKAGAEALPEGIYILRGEGKSFKLNVR